MTGGENRAVTDEVNVCAGGCFTTAPKPGAPRQGGLLLRRDGDEGGEGADREASDGSEDGDGDSQSARGPTEKLATAAKMETAIPSRRGGRRTPPEEITRCEPLIPLRPPHQAERNEEKESLEINSTLGPWGRGE